MKTSRILCSILVLSAFSGAAFAARITETNQCYTTKNTGIDYTVYFENDRPKERTDDGKTYRQLNQASKQNCINDLENTLGALRAENSDNCIILLGTADKKNDDKARYNTRLSIRRVKLVYNMLTDAISNGDCIQAYAGGAANSYMDQNEDNDDDYEERVVRVIITKKDVPPQDAFYDITMNITNNITNNQSTVVSSSTQINVNYDDSKLQAQQKTTEIGLIASELNRMNSEFERDRSHWKTASGNFNGARLASDSIAGVVLGTAGGLITSNIIKKNQISGGFEDLQCVIGGQIIADYNDEFTINMNLNR